MRAAQAPLSEFTSRLPFPRPLATSRREAVGYLRRVRLLVTNDDGIDAEGLHVLAQSLHRAGHDVVVAAPAADASGSGAALGVFHADSHIDVKRVQVPGCDAPAWAVAGL